ncbi:hypothetical protein P152DRAFT_192199 [Eremomyces bilateralis CBS 781.70]|uniref:Uncharacterized protein n=1 Tax=Eremomyces bilateralis CBS 781.70 TaxID=1392243 RepID=A0A6G1GC26_9PEZI|nr:uncharacterized protein P152DRAFT_192199 [Eremomyces bilateralis CBS 781.70]KAF1815645.1 hypothetical protein P152DRAFT_192199 [Eremomyces bilateralis CBS 781.70]
MISLPCKSSFRCPKGRFPRTDLIAFNGVASLAHQEHTENGILESDRAPGHEDISAGSGPGAAGAASPALIVHANVEAVDDKASSDDCAQSPTTELSDSLYAAYMPSCNGDGLASAQRSAPRPHFVADISGPVGKQLTASAGHGDGDDDVIVPASKAALQAKVRSRYRKAVYGPIHCKYSHPARHPVLLLTRILDNGR